MAHFVSTDSKMGNAAPVDMDMSALALFTCPGSDIGSSVELWEAALPVDDVFHGAGMLGYVLLSAIGLLVLTLSS